MSEKVNYLIWSNENNAWWNADGRGYTVDIESAGRYSLQDALRICNRANDAWNTDSDTIPSELPISEEVALELKYKKCWLRYEL
jgi:hypothetical protein